MSKGLNKLSEAEFKNKINLLDVPISNNV